MLGAALSSRKLGLCGLTYTHAFEKHEDPYSRERCKLAPGKGRKKTNETIGYLRIHRFSAAAPPCFL